MKHFRALRLALILSTSAAALWISCSEGGAQDAAFNDRLQTLELAAERIEDGNDIRRLQRAYGYYVDEGMWDEVSDLFAADGTIEIGLDGVYVGRERVREYLYALGGGQAGLSEGQLNEHLQLMPVVTVAPDGQTARARWRGLVLAGQLGEYAFWGEGPYENVYVKEDGIWKIQSLHWYQSVLVPYEGGWQVSEDANGAIWASDSLPPDRPPSVTYETWPETYLPPFHFSNPVLGATAMTRPAADGAGADDGFEDLAQRAAVLARKVQLLEDEGEIENLQKIYGFYTDKQLWTDAAYLFADDGTIEIGGSGIYQGPERIRAWLATNGPESPQEGRLFDQMQLQPVIHVAPDGQTARARWHMFAQEAVARQYAQWGLGVYENTYVHDDGVWKIQSLHQYTTMYTPYEDGWGKTALPLNGPVAELPPDRPPSTDYDIFPAVFVPPFHYENPVTGNPVYESTAADFAPPAPADREALEALLSDLDHRLGLLEDTDAIERLNAVYGYYLARNQWDDLAGIFSPEGSIEIAMRGVYVGPESVRRNLDLYGEPGVQHGLLHNHMQYQPVIHVAPDRQTAKMRSRAFSIMGEFGAYSMWMGGVYENNFVREDGVWKILTDQVFNTYFAQYSQGWEMLDRRQPPGLSADNPPDLGPTTTFEMFPSAFLPPFHYDHPVLGAEGPDRE